MPNCSRLPQCLFRQMVIRHPLLSDTHPPTSTGVQLREPSKHRMVLALNSRASQVLSHRAHLWRVLLIWLNPKLHGPLQKWGIILTSMNPALRPVLLNGPRDPTDSPTCLAYPPSKHPQLRLRWTDHPLQKVVHTRHPTGQPLCQTGDHP